MTDTTTDAASGDRLCHCVWNRDVVAALNFRHILHGLRENQKKPERFSCSINTSPSTGLKRKNTSSAVSSRLYSHRKRHSLIYLNKSNCFSA
ncbi:hypothetical protein BDF14DRAFT_1753932 [Spinellus fusiger]|nr:hypothetical protein BDF14DRAFT_1753932 [Spinellus fusiger]